MIDIEKLARESGAELSHDGSEQTWWWWFSPDELQLYTEKIMQAAQAAERERAKVLVEALRACDEAMGYMSEYDIPLTLPKQVKDAITKHEGETSGI